MYVAIATWKSDKQVWMEMERGFKTYFVLIKLCGGGEDCANLVSAFYEYELFDNSVFCTFYAD